MGLERGHILLTYVAGNYEDIVQVLDVPKLSDGLWHHIEISANPATIKLDDKFIDCQNYSNGSLFLTDAVLYLGGIPRNLTKEKIISVSAHSFSRNFEGCIESVILGKGKTIESFNKYDGENVNVCNIV